MELELKLFELLWSIYCRIFDLLKYMCLLFDFFPSVMEIDGSFAIQTWK